MKVVTLFLGRRTENREALQGRNHSAMDGQKAKLCLHISISAFPMHVYTCTARSIPLTYSRVYIVEILDFMRLESLKRLLTRHQPRQVRPSLNPWQHIMGK